MANLYTVAVGEHEHTPHVILNPTTTGSGLKGLQIAVPRFSPDGKKIALIGGLMSDQGSTGGDVWVVAADGKSAPVDVTPGIDGTPVFELWLDEHTVGIVEDRRGHTLLVAWDVNKEAVARELNGDVASTDLDASNVSGGSIKGAVSYSGKADTAAFVRSGISTPPEVWLLVAGKPKQFSHLNDNMPARATAKIESIEWKSDNFNVQGWLTYPTGYDPAKKYPMIVTVHGGPSSSAFPRGTQWADLGYFEFQPNPRGSFGQGEAFTAANRKDFGYGDLRDILAGVDAVEKKVSIDDHRLGLTGWSYGGFMSMFAETQTNRFAAIVAGAGISDWKSYYGENSIDQWMVPFFGATVYDDPAVYAKSSAIEYIKNSKTPMLIIVGDRDGECPAPQSFEMCMLCALWASRHNWSCIRMRATASATPLTSPTAPSAHRPGSPNTCPPVPFPPKWGKQERKVASRPTDLGGPSFGAFAKGWGRGFLSLPSHSQQAAVCCRKRNPILPERGPKEWATNVPQITSHPVPFPSSFRLNLSPISVLRHLPCSRPPSTLRSRQQPGHQVLAEPSFSSSLWQDRFARARRGRSSVNGEVRCVGFWLFCVFFAAPCLLARPSPVAEAKPSPSSATVATPAPSWGRSRPSHCRRPTSPTAFRLSTARLDRA